MVMNNNHAGYNFNKVWTAWKLKSGLSMILTTPTHWFVG